MNLWALSNDELSLRLEKLAHSERKITHLILVHINEIESRRLYAELGYESMFRYLTRHLKYSEDAAYRRLSAARLLKKSPEIAERLEDGRLTLTQLAQVQSAIRHEIKNSPTESKDRAAANIPQILEKIESKSSFETKKTLALEFNLPIETHETVSPQKDESVRLEITLTMEQLKTLETARDLMSHTLPEGNWAELLTLLAEKQIKKILGKDIDAVDSPSEDSATQGFLAAQKRGHIKVTTKRKLLLTAGYCCEYQNPNSGIKCGSKYQLQVDHIQPIAFGGNNERQNLRVLCRTHNLQAAAKLGLKTIR
jgi:hypothetical protein